MSFETAGRASWGPVSNDRVLDAGAAYGDRWPTLQAWIAAGMPREPLLDGLSDGPPLEGLTYLPVIPAPAIIAAVAMNFRAEGAPASPPEGYPVLFLRLPSSQIGHGAPLVLPAVSDKLDYEGELAVIIGEGGRHIRSEDAWSHVAGYACYNDGSVRDWQKHSHQFTAGKNFAGTGAFGPWMVTADEVPDPEALTLETFVNGERRQHARISQLIHDIPWLISYLSRITPLSPGDVIVTGSSTGFGSTMTPPVFLRPGDVVEVRISGIGALRNRIEREATP